MLLGRRRFMGAGALGAAALFLGGHLVSRSAQATGIAGSLSSSGKNTLLGFDSIAISTADQLSLPPGYVGSVLIRWGEPLHANTPVFDPTGNGSAEDQAKQFGDNNDGMSLFPFPSDSRRALLAINNEYGNYRTLFAHQGQPRNHEEVRKAQACVGVSVIEIALQDGAWRFVQGSAYNRRLHANTPMRISGPAAGHALLHTADDNSGTQVLGTFQNCANGQTPWGTYLTCEENFTDCFASTDPALPLGAALKRYGVKTTGNEIGWHLHDPRFDLAKTPQEVNRHGWIVEIDPFDPLSTPVKRTALGRFKHENAAWATSAKGHAVVYMGDDERGEFIYRFISRDPVNTNSAAANRNLLDHGTLYVARFDDGQGQWLELTQGRNGLNAANGFHSQAQVLIHARLAASKVGATPMDRPEWLAVNPDNGQVYCTLTNNTQRGTEGQPMGGPNPREKNLYGQILRWKPMGGDHGAAHFEWDLFAVAGNPLVHPNTPYAGSPNIHPGNLFNSPDGLGFDEAGRLWILTDGDYSNAGEYAGMGNNQMLCADPNSGEIRRFMVGPVGSEVTGICFAPDQRTLFVGIQHPGEKGGSTFPDHLPGGTPRASVMMIRRDDGGVIGA